MQKNINLDKLAQDLEKILPKECILRDEVLAGYTTFKIGGPADILVLPRTLEELAALMAYLHETGVAVTVIGGGSNVLVRDGGIRGVIVVLKDMLAVLRAEGVTVRASAGHMMKDVSEFARKHGLSGLEFACGIPGSLGGAVFMNAGAYGGEMSHVVTSVKAVTREGKIVEHSIGELAFSYRHSLFHDNGEIIGEIKLTLEPGSEDRIQAKMDELTEKRESRQPLEYASAGSTFKRPPGHFAGTLIDQTGLKGLSVGDAEVSKKHAGFVINKGHASFKDVHGVIKEVQRRIKEAHDVDLETEVRILGEDEK